jgi:hypothetical protein
MDSMIFDGDKKNWSIMHFGISFIGHLNDGPTFFGLSVIFSIVHKKQGQIKIYKSAVVLIIPQGGWLLGKHSTMCKLFCDPRIEISMPNNPHSRISKVSLVTHS